MNSTYQVKLDTFEGPLDLLLHLINRMEIDIYDIPVAEITDQYMDYVHAMQQIELDLASEYLVMAATLLEMKSRMLLPNTKIEEDLDSEEDLREQLLQRLLEYRKFKKATTQLKEKELEANQLYVRSKKRVEETVDTEVVKNEHPVSVFALVDALHDITERKGFFAPITTTLPRSDISVEDRMEEVLTHLTDEPIAFTDLFAYPDKQHIVATFLAVLQLLKNNDIHCQQKAQFEPIFVSRMEG